MTTHTSYEGLTKRTGAVDPTSADYAMGNGLCPAIQELYPQTIPVKIAVETPKLHCSRRTMPIRSYHTPLGFARLNVERLEQR